jgi:hypothetical protein
MSTPPINYGEIFKDGLFKDTLKKSVKEMDVSVSDTTKKRYGVKFRQASDLG